MRIRATVGAVSGALALSALVAPMAQADSGHDLGLERQTVIAEHFGAAQQAAQAAPKARALSAADAAPVVEKVTVNDGKDVIVNGKSAKTFTVYVRASHPSGILDAYMDYWHGPDLDNVDGYLPPNDLNPDDAYLAKCAVDNVQDPTTSTCKLTITATPGLTEASNLYSNDIAGTWNVTAAVLANDASEYWNDFYTTSRVKRESKVTVNAAPEPVAKGKTITVTGKLTRSSWVSGSDLGYGGQSVQLQFRKYGTSTYTTLKTVKSSSTSGSTGALKTTVTASADGYFRYVFAGNVTSSPATAAGDFVDVK